MAGGGIDHGAGKGGSPFAGARVWGPRKGPVERLCELACQLIMVAMIVLISVEVLLRGGTDISLEMADELGGYMLVALTFLSLPVCQVDHAFHRVEFVQARLSDRARAWCELTFDSFALAVAGVLLWQLVRLEINAWQSGDLAPTVLMTPLWIPQLSMAIGAAFLCFTLVRTVARDLARLAAGATGAKIVNR